LAEIYREIIEEKSIEEVEICKNNQIKIQDLTKEIYLKVHDNKRKFSRKPYSRNTTAMN